MPGGVVAVSSARGSSGSHGRENASANADGCVLGGGAEWRGTANDAATHEAMQRIALQHASHYGSIVRGVRFIIGTNISRRMTDLRLARALPR